MYTTLEDLDTSSWQVSQPPVLHDAATETVNLPWNAAGPGTLAAPDPAGALSGVQPALTVDWVQSLATPRAKAGRWQSPTHAASSVTGPEGLFFLRARERRAVDNLSPREFILAELLASGMTQKQIAFRIGRSPETIRSQVKAISAKMEINNVALLAPPLVARQ